jgi:hypothetical protein
MRCPSGCRPAAVWIGCFDDRYWDSASSEHCEHGNLGRQLTGVRHLQEGDHIVSLDAEDLMLGRCWDLRRVVDGRAEQDSCQLPGSFSRQGWNQRLPL